MDCGKIFFKKKQLFKCLCTLLSCTCRDMPADKKSFPTQTSLKFIYHFVLLCKGNSH